MTSTSKYSRTPRQTPQMEAVRLVDDRAGGTEALPVADMPGIGRVAYLLDPDSNVFGLISPVLSDGTNVMAATPAVG